jgi:hypothetical protein
MRMITRLIESITKLCNHNTMKIKFHKRVPVKCETKSKRNETKSIEAKRNQSKRSKTNRNETKPNETKPKSKPNFKTKSSHFMKWPRYRRVISLEIQVGITSQINKWANTDPKKYRRWDQVPRRSDHHLLTGRTRREPQFKSKNHQSNQCV